MANPVAYESTDYARGVVRTPPLVLEAGETPRLNLVLPHLSSREAFGGVTGAMELTRELSAGYEAVRFISLSPLDPGGLFDFSQWTASPGIATSAIWADPGKPLPVTPGDLFLCTYWPSALMRREQARLMAAAGLPEPGYYWFIQDWEPGFYPLGCKYQIARDLFVNPGPVHAIVNSSELAAYLAEAGCDFPSRTVLKPSLNTVLRGRLEELGFKLPPKPDDRLTILIYGRPMQPRNCFATILEALRILFASMAGEERAFYEVVSAGQPHEDIRLLPGCVVRSLGKLSLADYADLLLRSHVGVSLMASPHPSYPPLEMAAYGLFTVTSSFPGKELSKAHPCLSGVAVPEPRTLALAILEAVKKAVSVDIAGRPAHIPENMSPLPWRENIRAAAIPRIAPASENRAGKAPSPS